MRERSSTFINSRAFGGVAFSLVTINVVLMTLDGYPADPTLLLLLERSNFLFTLFFAFEVCHPAPAAPPLPPSTRQPSARQGRSPPDTHPPSP